MVEKCRSALVGEGPPIAPRSHVWKGIWAALVMPANASATAKTNTQAAAGLGDAHHFINTLNDRMRQLKTTPRERHVERDAAQHVHDDLAECVS